MKNLDKLKRLVVLVAIPFAGQLVSMVILQLLSNLYISRNPLCGSVSFHKTSLLLRVILEVAIPFAGQLVSIAILLKYMI